MNTKLRYVGVRAVRKIGKILGYKIDFAPLSMQDKGEHKARYFARLLEKTSSVPGVIVECGLGNGVSFGWLSKAAYAQGKRLYGFDSFEGFPPPSPQDASAYAVKAGDWGNIDISNVRNNVLQHVSKEFFDTSVTITPGFFSDTVAQAGLGQISFLHLDVDLYQSYIDCLVPLYDKVTPGGIIAFDEVLNGVEYAKYPGGYIAIQEFFADKNVELCRDIASGKYYALKR